MFIYILLFLFFSILLFFEYCKKPILYSKMVGSTRSKSYRIRTVSLTTFFTFFVLLLLFVLTGWRASSVGNDTKMYLLMYHQTSTDISTPVTFEVGYRFYTYFLYKIGISEHWFLIITAAITYFILFVVIKKYSWDPAISVLLFFSIFFSAFLNTLRQNIAVSFVVLVYFLWRNKKWLWAVVCFILAILFHTAALVSIFIFIYQLFPKNKFLVFALALLFSALSLFGLITPILSRIIPNYNIYFSSEYVGSGRIAVTFYAIRAIFIFCLFSFIYEKEKTRNNRMLLSMATILLLLTCLGFSVSLFFRAAEFYLFIFVIELPCAIYKGKKERSIAFFICAISLMFFAASLIFRPEWNKMIPYNFWS